LSKPNKVVYEGQLVSAEQLDFEAEKEPWAVYKLEDGTVLRFKQTLVTVSKVVGQFKDGDPIYVFQIGGLFHADVPEELKEKAG
jgi:hypothetical protein